MHRKDLNKAGLKATAPRMKVLEFLEKGAGQHFSAEDIYRSLVQSGEDIGLATVYRVLAQFEQAGLVNRHNFETDHAVFELDQGGHHDHMVCVETGKVIEFVNKDVEDLQRQIADEHGYDLIDHKFVLYVRPKT